MEQSDLFLTVDTGATYIAATTGVPIVVVYGCTSPKRWAPYNEKAITISRDPECCPCKIGEDECDARECLGSITVDEVYETATGLLYRYNYVSAGVVNREA